MAKRKPAGNGYQCAKCKTPLQGRARRWCDEHRPDKSNRKRLAEAARAAGDEERAAAILGAGSEQALLLAHGAELVATTLRDCDYDPIRAAAAVGLQVSPEVAVQLAEEAVERHGDIIRREPKAFIEMGLGAGFVFLAQAKARAPMMPPASYGTTMKQITEGIRELRALGRTSKTRIRVALQEEAPK